ncbi:hypothetical protein DFH11DRAFT_1745601 [Phellopilus nigrolimitatus]|nr:hypothetical protein DFH11DRAFT_1745601 [Phellopilus nigrolimitatus]
MTSERYMTRVHNRHKDKLWRANALLLPREDDAKEWQSARAAPSAALEIHVYIASSLTPSYIDPIPLSPFLPMHSDSPFAPIQWSSRRYDSNIVAENYRGAVRPLTPRNRRWPFTSRAEATANVVRDHVSFYTPSRMQTGETAPVKSIIRHSRSADRRQRAQSDAFNAAEISHRSDDSQSPGVISGPSRPSDSRADGWNHAYYWISHLNLVMSNS